MFILFIRSFGFIIYIIQVVGIILSLVYSSWDGPVQTIEREETIQEANNEAAAAAQDDSVQINHNRVDEESESFLRPLYLSELI
jgi:hypothetical protein